MTSPTPISCRPRPPLRSVRTLFLLAMAVLVAVISVPLLIAGGYLMDSLISRFSEEILTEKLDSLLTPIDLRYERLRRVGLEDSAQHRQEILQDGLDSLALFRYRESGTVFAVRRDGTILLSAAFNSPTDPNYSRFLKALTTHRQGLLHYHTGRGERMAAVRYYPPWESYVGLAINRDELFAPRTMFFSIHLVLLAVVVAIAALFTSGLQRYIISPIIRLADFATRIRHGEHDASPQAGDFILELAILRDDLLAMVSALHRQMQETSRQLTVIQAREAELDQAVVRLREGEERYREIFNAPSDAIFIHDADTGRIVDINRATEEMYGYSREDALQQPVAAFSAGTPPYGQQEATAWLVAAIQDGPQLFQWRARRKNGELFWAEVALRLSEFQGQRFVIAVVRDIDARKRAEAALMAEKERLAVTLRSIADGVITTDTNERVTLLNPVAEQLTGWRQSEAISHPFAEVFALVAPHNGAPCSLPSGPTATAPFTKGMESELVLIDRQGSRHQLAVSATAMLDPNSRVIGRVIVFRDITEKLRTEQELLKIKKLEAVGVLAAGIAHDFNNLLAAILGNLDLAAVMMPADHRSSKLLREASRGCLRARDLTLQLLTFAKGGSPIRTVGSIADMVQESTTFILRGSPVTCDFDIPEDLWLVNADQGQLSQVIQNLVLNARQAMPEGGRVLVSCRNQEERDAQGQVSRWVVIAIHDTGPGMNEEQLSRIFEPYFTTKPDGSGLGLSICHAIIAKHDGRIEASSVPGQGATLTILLPASDRTPPTAPTPQEPISQTAHARVLLMDDEEMVREIAINMLEHLGHHVQAVIDGASAVAAYQQAQEAGQPFNLVIMDLTIPGGMGGKEAVAQVLALDPEAKVVVASGYSDDPVMAEYRKYGFVGVMAKPFLLDDLIRLLAQVLPGSAQHGLSQKTD